MADFPAVELQNATKAYPGGIRAVDGVSMSIPAGRVVALLGPSGCGKTTTLRLINRLEEATGGAVLVRGQNVRGQRPEVLRRSIGYVIQEGGLFPHVDVSANVGTVPRLLGWSRARIRRRVAEVLEMVGLPEADFGQRMPAQLSGGQRQRVGVARALAADPDLLLMDEPFGALDPGTRASIHAEFLRLNAQLRKTVVMVTHDIAEAGRLAEEIVLLDHGRIVQRGSLRDLLLNPTDERVRLFLGGRAAELALSVLSVGQIVDGLPPASSPAGALHLAADLPLGQALAVLAGVAEDTGVVVDGAAARMCSAEELRARILAELEAAAGGRRGDSEP